jgi:nucleoside-diphosphate-sugar epimerase
MKLVAITGGAGRIGTALRPLLREHYRLRLLDVRRPTTELVGSEEFQTADVSVLAALEAAFEGADAILHLAGQASPSENWSGVLKHNIEGTRAVFEAARRKNVNKVVFASTNHVMGFYNLERSWPIDERAPIRPDSLYGVSKAFGETIARYYVDAFEMSIICLRIGWFTPDGPSTPSLNPLWISARDLAQIVRLSIETPRRFGIYNATSKNTPAQWDLASARAELGFAPVDDVSSIATDARSGPYVDPRAGVLADL